MRHIHQEEALTVLRAQPFTAEEMLLIEAAADALSWEEIESEIKDLQNPAMAEKAKDAMFEKIGALDQEHHGLAGMCIFAAAMYGTAKRLYAAGIPQNDRVC